MSDPKSCTHPYTLEVTPNPQDEWIWQWTIRKHGKLVQRSDRAQPSEAKARAQGTETIEKMRHSGSDTRY